MSMPSIEARSERHGRVVARSRKRALATRDEIPESDVDSVEGNSVSTQTDLSMRGMEEVIAKREDEISDLQTQLEVTKEENKKLHQTTKKIEQQLQEYKLNEASFENDNNKVLYYTGLTTWELLQKLFIYIKPHLKQHSSLSPFQQLLVTLLRLRLNLSGIDLGYRFAVHASTISRTFEFVISVLYAKLTPLIIWPDRDALTKTMPMVFRKHYPSCVVIIDCFDGSPD